MVAINMYRIITVLIIIVKSLYWFWFIIKFVAFKLPSIEFNGAAPLSKHFCRISYPFDKPADIVSLVLTS